MRRGETDGSADPSHPGEHEDDSSLPTAATLLEDRVLKTTRSAERRMNEVRHYAAMAGSPPPFAAPRLLGEHDDVITLSRMSGRTLGQHKLLDEDISALAARRCAALTKATATWRPGVGGFCFDYDRQVARGADRGLWSLAEADRLRACARLAPRVFQHGDLIPPNIIVSREHVALIDFEWSGPAVDGLDWARLLTNGWNARTLRRELLRCEIAQMMYGAVNWAAVLAHELHQVERDGGDEPWARAAAHTYRSQLPALHSLFVRTRIAGS